MKLHPSEQARWGARRLRMNGAPRFMAGTEFLARLNARYPTLHPSEQARQGPRSFASERVGHPDLRGAPGSTTLSSEAEGGAPDGHRVFVEGAEVGERWVRFVAGVGRGWYAEAQVRGLFQFGTAARPVLHEDPHPHRAPWFSVPGSCCSACTGLLRGFAGVSDGDSGRGGGGGSGAVCAVAIEIIQ